MAKELKNLES
ncbi:hypothetical protein CGLO_14142 [Colletotrichum gloeosporioides Cg-14]|uniref:Uncharacterized protein n=1 Tax=Colletotrichum gloeosporioides (strain Cg-14) TaxID=1237896 RepID=T0JUY0_COLGC|nr:hypothetical protein CGLO_14142 [Colletotrichum gloeosporioides Cg-14]